MMLVNPLYGYPSTFLSRLTEYKCCGTSDRSDRESHANWSEPTSTSTIHWCWSHFTNNLSIQENSPSMVFMLFAMWLASANARFQRWMIVEFSSLYLGYFPFLNMNTLVWSNLNICLSFKEPKKTIYTSIWNSWMVRCLQHETRRDERRPHSVPVFKQLGCGWWCLRRFCIRLKT